MHRNSAQGRPAQHEQLDEPDALLDPHAGLLCRALEPVDLRVEIAQRNRAVRDSGLHHAAATFGGFGGAR
jgi:hypothetical protein